MEDKLANENYAHDRTGLQQVSAPRGQSESAENERNFNDAEKSKRVEL